MKRKIRYRCFETNSSSIHSMCICTEEDYEKWKNGEMVYNDWIDKIVPLDELETEKQRDPHIYHIKTFEEWNCDNGIRNLDTYEENFTDSNNNKFIIFGHYGNCRF